MNIKNKLFLDENYENNLKINLKLENKKFSQFYHFLGKLIEILKIKTFRNDFSIVINSQISIRNNEAKLIGYLADLYQNYSDIILRHDLNCSIKKKNCQVNEIFSSFTKPLNSYKKFFTLIEYFSNNQYFNRKKEIKKEPSEKKRKCEKCKRKMDKITTELVRITKSSKFNSLVKKDFGFYKIKKEKIYLLFPHLRNIYQKHFKFDEKYESVERKIQEKYIFKKYYLVKIIKKENDSELVYHIQKNIKEKYIEYINILEDYIEPKLIAIDPELNYKLEKKIEYLNNQIEILIQNHNKKLNLIKSKISFFLTIRYLNLDNLFPFLLDNEIEEIFLDSVSDYIYLNHQKYGRLNTCINLSIKEIEALKTHLILESRAPLDEKNPSLIYVIDNNYFNCRFSIDIWPSHWKNIAIDIRKLNKKIFTLFDLIKSGTLNKEMGVFLILAILLKINITITGEVNSGKTTLMNAMDLLVPKALRKIYVEETIETIQNPIDKSHQLKYVARKEKKDIDKAREINKLLHRSGDLIFLGEILNKEDTNAFFHCLSTGLKGFQTTHSRTIRSLINRWTIHYKVNKNCLNDLGIIILMKKINIKRKILKISEIEYKNNEIHIKDFFSYSPERKNGLQWDKELKFTDSNIYQYLNSFLNINDKNLDKIQNIISKFIETELHCKNNQNIFGKIDKILPRLQKILSYLGGV